MTGYVGYAKSNNAVDAEASGRFPASRLVEYLPGVSAAAVKKLLAPCEWHHCSKMYNEVDFYDLEDAVAFFESGEGSAALAEFKAESKEKSAVRVYLKCSVKWLEWAGTRRRPTCDECSAKNATVRISGKTATVEYVHRWKNAAAKRRQKKITFKKRLTTNGFIVLDANGEVVT